MPDSPDIPKLHVVPKPGAISSDSASSCTKRKTIPTRPVPPQTSRKARASLIFGVLSLLLPFPAAIPAIILGHVSRSEIYRGAGRLAGKGMALAGLILGYGTLMAVPATILVVMAIPARPHPIIMANEADGVASVRSLNLLETRYSTAFPGIGYADLAALGPGSSNCKKTTRENACLLDETLGCPSGTSGEWCVKGAYKYMIVKVRGPYSDGPYDYIITAVPIKTGLLAAIASKTGIATTGIATKSYCSTSDGIVRFQDGLPESAPLHTVLGCELWTRLKSAQ